MYIFKYLYICIHLNTYMYIYICTYLYLYTCLHFVYLGGCILGLIDACNVYVTYRAPKVGPFDDDLDDDDEADDDADDDDEADDDDDDTNDDALDAIDLEEDVSEDDDSEEEGWGDDEKGFSVKVALCYLLDSEREGYVDGRLFSQIGQYYGESERSTQNASLAMVYFQRAIGMGYEYAYQVSNYLRYLDTENFPDDTDEDIKTLYEAGSKGVKQEEILENLLDYIIGTYDMRERVPKEYMCGYKTEGELVLHHCDVLIKNGSPLGYQWKGEMFWDGYIGVHQNRSKALLIYEEADRRGLASYNIYCFGPLGLADTYMYVYLAYLTIYSYA